MVEAALEYAAAGLKVFPLRERGKVPIVPRGHLEATTDEAQIREWWETRPEANIGLVAGDGLAVLDVDAGKGGLETLRRLYEAHGKIDTRAVKTGSGGLHLYLRDDPENPLPQGAGKIGRGLDTRAGGKGYIVAPPSVHPDGPRYEVVKDVELAPVPDWLRELARNGTRGSEFTDGEPIPEGQRNHALASLAGALRRRGLNPDAIEAALVVENRERCDPPLPADEVRAIAHSVSRYAPADDYTDTGPAAQEEFTADPDAGPPPASPGRQVDYSDEWAVSHILPRVRARLRYIPSRKASEGWLVWRGHHWDMDGALEHERIVRDELQRLALWLRDRAAASPTKAQGKPMRSAAQRLQSNTGIQAVKRLLRAHLTAAPEDFDADRHVLNTPTGVVDLRTGDTRPVTEGEQLMRSTTTAPEDGERPRWAAFLASLTEGDQELIHYLQKVCGYVLTGDMSEKALWYVHGTADTGKSTFIKVITELVGTYADSVDVSAFITSTTGDRIPDDLARLVGVRLVTATEPAADHAWDERRIKAITGGDEISARFLYGSWFTYQPQFKICIVGNHEPEIRNVDEAMMRRIHIVPFEHRVPMDKQIPNLAEKLLAYEGPQILQWMIDGCLLWRKEGLDPPEAVVERTEQYGADEDLVQQWLDEECETGSPEYEASRRALYNSWSSWCKSRGERPGTLKQLKRRLDPKARELMFESAQVGDRRLQGYRGIRLRPRTEIGDFDE